MRKAKHFFDLLEYIFVRLFLLALLIIGAITVFMQHLAVASLKYSRRTVPSAARPFNRTTLMNNKTRRKTYRITYTDGRPDQNFELEAEAECQHSFVPLGDVPTMTPSRGGSSFTKGGCLLCGGTYVEEMDTEDQHVAYYRLVK